MRPISMHPVWMTAIAAVALLLSGCSTSDVPSPAALGGPPKGMHDGSSPNATGHDRLAQRAASLEQSMMIGPVAARSLGLHPTWGVTYAPDDGVRTIWPTDNGVFVVDGRNELSMLDTDTGLRQWRAFVADPGHRVLDLHLIKKDDLVVVLRSDAVVTVDATTGFPKGPMNDIVAAVQRLQWLASTGGIIDGSQFIYGAFGGEVAWQAWNRGYSTRAHRVGRRIALPPVQSGDTIIAASKSGHVSALSASSGALIWSRTLLDSLGSTPVCSDDYVYLSGLDQHLRCLSLRDNGRPLWTALLKAPLTASATLIDDVVYQQVHGTGLTAWQATPANAPDGVLKWTAAAVTGDVLATYGDLLLTWDPQLGTLATISPLTGSIDVQLNLAPGTRVQTSAIENGRVFIISPKGRIESLIPAR